jgi:hypothetical protein
VKPVRITWRYTARLPHASTAISPANRSAVRTSPSEQPRSRAARPRTASIRAASTSASRTNRSAPAIRSETTMTGLSSTARTPGVGGSAPHAPRDAPASASAANRSRKSTAPVYHGGRAAPSWTPEESARRLRPPGC